MCTSIDTHDIGAAYRFQLLIAAPEVLHHPILPVSDRRSFIRRLDLIVPFALFHVFLRTPVLFAVLLPIGFQIGQIPRPGSFPGMAHVGAVEHGLRILLLDLFQKILLDLGAACCTFPVLELQIQQFIIVGLHPQVQKLCIRIREFHKQIPHSFFVILAPDGKFLVENALLAVFFSVKIDFALRPIFYITPEQPHQQGHN